MDLETFRERRAANKPRCAVTKEDHIRSHRAAFDAARKEAEEKNQLAVWFIVYRGGYHGIFFDWLLLVYDSYYLATDKTIVSITKENWPENESFVYVFFVPKGTTNEELEYIHPKYKVRT